MTGWLMLSPDQAAEVGAEWLALRAREHRLPPVEDRPPVEVRGLSDAGPVRRVELAEVAVAS